MQNLTKDLLEFLHFWQKTESWCFFMVIVVRIVGTCKCMTKIIFFNNLYHIYFLAVWRILYQSNKDFMSVIYVLLTISLIISVSFLAAFIYSLKKGQFDDDYTPSVRILFDDKEKISEQ